MKMRLPRKKSFNRLKCFNCGCIIKMFRAECKSPPVVTVHKPKGRTGEIPVPTVIVRMEEQFFFCGSATLRAFFMPERFYRIFRNFKRA